MRALFFQKNKKVTARKFTQVNKKKNKEVTARKFTQVNNNHINEGRKQMKS
jgi:hypothetical protein